MADKIFRIILNTHWYDEYDSAIVQCESLDKLNCLIDRKAFDYEFLRYNHFPSESVYRKEFDFDINASTGQKIESIEELGTASNPMPDGYEAAILCSSFNAG